MTHAETPEDEKMRRIKEIDEYLYDGILEIESKIMIEMTKKMGELTKVKDLALSYKKAESRKAFLKVKKKYAKRPTSRKGT